MRDALFASLNVAAKDEDCWTQTKALRLLGETQGQAHVMWLGKLQRSKQPVGKAAKPAKARRYQQQAERLAGPRPLEEWQHEVCQDQSGRGLHARETGQADFDLSLAVGLCGSPDGDQGQVMQDHAFGPGQNMVENGDYWVIAGAIFGLQNSLQNCFTSIF